MRNKVKALLAVFAICTAVAVYGIYVRMTAEDVISVVVASTKQSSTEMSTYEEGGSESVDEAVIDCSRLKFISDVNDDSINAILDKVTFCLDDNQATRLTLTSDGGYPQSAHGFFDSVMSHKNRKLLTTIAVGNVNSAGVTMFMVGEQRLITPSTTMLIHLTVSELRGWYDFLELQAELDELKLLQDIQVRIVAYRSGRPYSEVQEAMIKSTTYDAEEAVKLGIATAVLEHSGS